MEYNTQERHRRDTTGAGVRHTMAKGMMEQPRHREDGDPGAEELHDAPAHLGSVARNQQSSGGFRPIPIAMRHILRCQPMGSYPEIGGDHNFSINRSDGGIMHSDEGIRSPARNELDFNLHHQTRDDVEVDVSTPHRTEEVQKPSTAERFEEQVIPRHKAEHQEVVQCIAGPMTIPDASNRLYWSGLI